MLKSLALAALLAETALAAVPLYGQCGGNNYTGETTCVSGAYCQWYSEWYSQCIPGTASSTSSSSSRASSSSSTSRASSSSSTSRSSSTSSSTRASSSSSAAPSASASCASTSSFVKISGQKFTLNGATYTLVGHNNYWVPQMTVDADVDEAFADIANTGATTVRTWGFNEVTAASGTYYHLWSGSTATVNYGTDGLGRFDTVIAYAKAHCLRLIVALTNNWTDYGGMDVYVKQILGSTNHTLFYTDATVKAAFKTYIAAFVGRYKNEPTILAWELANEPRCNGCSTSIINAWATEMSAYIKSLDSNHLVSIGDEGFGLSGSTDYVYTYNEGLDFAANLAISTVDFGTFHAYPNSWGASGDYTTWGQKWITDHYAIQVSANKPVILEEYGVPSDQYNVYNGWLATVVSSGLTGDLIWQAGSYLSWGSSWDDGYAIYPDDPVYPLLTSHSAALKARG